MAGAAPDGFAGTDEVTGSAMADAQADRATPRPRLPEAERLATLAAIAQPVQHELNNLLTVIFANLDLLRRRVPEGAPQRQLERCAEAARRFEVSTRAVLSLARRPVSGEVVISPVEAVRALEPLLQVLLPAPEALRLELQAEVPPCRFDRALLDEALIALARAAAGRGGGLRVEVALKGSGSVALTVGLSPEALETAESGLARLQNLATSASAALIEVPETAPGQPHLLHLLLPAFEAGLDASAGIAKVPQPNSD
jgi:signal transduction histidine kinase